MTGLNPNRYIPLHEPQPSIQETPLAQRFKQEEIEHLIECLKFGHRIVSMNEFQSDQKYLTITEGDGETRSLRTDCVLPLMLPKGRISKETSAIQQLEKLLEDMKAEKTN